MPFMAFPGHKILTNTNLGKLCSHTDKGKGLFKYALQIGASFKNIYKN